MYLEDDPRADNKKRRRAGELGRQRGSGERNAGARLLTPTARRKKKKHKKKEKRRERKARPPETHYFLPDAKLRPRTRPAKRAGFFQVAAAFGQLAFLSLPKSCAARDEPALPALDKYLGRGVLAPARICRELNEVSGVY